MQNEDYTLIEAQIGYLDNNGLLYTMSDEISEPSPEKAINQLQELAQKGYFTMPIYDFKETYDNMNRCIPKRLKNTQSKMKQC